MGPGPGFKDPDQSQSQCNPAVGRFLPPATSDVVASMDKFSTIRAARLLARWVSLGIINRCLHGILQSIQQHVVIHRLHQHHKPRLANLVQPHG